MIWWYCLMNVRIRKDIWLISTDPCCVWSGSLSWSRRLLCRPWGESYGTTGDFEKFCTSYAFFPLAPAELFEHKCWCRLCFRQHGRGGCILSFWECWVGAWPLHRLTAVICRRKPTARWLRSISFQSRTRTVDAAGVSSSTSVVIVIQV